MRRQCISSSRRLLSTSKGALRVGPDGVKMPRIGYGTAVFVDIGPNQKNHSDLHGFNMVKWALAAGYRLIDTAQMYYNEKVIGNALRDTFSKGELSREEIFVSTKVAHPNFPGSHERCPYVDDPGLSAYEGASKDIDGCLEDLGLEYVDSLLVHWPGQIGNTDAGLGKAKRAEIWAALEDAHKAGKARTIGVSNFELYHMDQLAESWTMRPMLNQIECSPYLPREELVEEMQASGTQVMCYCPLGSGLLGVLDDPVIKEISSRHSSTPAQVVLSWHVHRNCVPVPKSTNQQRLESNIGALNVDLTEEEISLMTSLARPNARVCPDPSEIL